MNDVCKGWYASRALPQKTTPHLKKIGEGFKKYLALIIA